MTLHPTFYLVSGRDILRSCQAEHIREATARLKPKPDAGEFCVSRASWELGFPKALAPSRCRSCGVRDRRDGYDRCAPCQTQAAKDNAREVRREANRRYRDTMRADVKARRKEQNKLRKREVYAAQRNGTIRAGVERRRAKLTTENG